MPFSFKSRTPFNFSPYVPETRTAMNAKISVFFISVEAIMYLLLYNLHDCPFK